MLQGTDLKGLSMMAERNMCIREAGDSMNSLFLVRTYLY